MIGSRARAWALGVFFAVLFASFGLGASDARGQDASPSPSPSPSGCVWDPACGPLVPGEPPPPTASPTPTPSVEPDPTPSATPDRSTPRPTKTPKPKPTEQPETLPGDAGEQGGPGGDHNEPQPPPDGWSTEVPDPSIIDGWSSENPPFKALPGPRSTVAVLDLLEEKGVGPERAARILAPFPVFGAAVYSNDWHNARHTPSFHLHEGTDIFAARGTPAVASADGTISRVTPTSKVGGTSLWITSKDGTGFYYAHLDSIADGIQVGTRVRTGDLVGRVGSTGNAAGGAPHLHFEVHPKMGPAVPPVPYLDTWLHAALVEAQALPGGQAAPTRLGSPSLIAGWAPAPPSIGAPEGLSFLPTADHQHDASEGGTWPMLLTVAVPLGLLLRPRRRDDRPWMLKVRG